MKHIDGTDLVSIARVLKADIETTMEDGCRDYAGWAYKSSRALSAVLREMGQGSLNPFNEEDWKVIVSGE